MVILVDHRQVGVGYVDCAAFCCLASCAVHCVLRLVVCADCLYAWAAYDRHHSACCLFTIYSIPACQNDESDSLSKWFDVKTVYISNIT